MADDKRRLSNEMLKKLLEFANERNKALELQELDEFLGKYTPDLIEDTLEFLEKNDVLVLIPGDCAIEDNLPEMFDNEVIESNEEEIDLRSIDMFTSEGVSLEDPVKMYLKDIGKVSLLSCDEEIELAKQIEEGKRVKAEIDALKKEAGDKESVKEHDMLMKKAESIKEKNAAVIQKGNSAKDRLTEANLRLVVSIAKRYVGRGLQLLDLIQEGNSGLLKAVDKYDHTKGFKFSTYATWWIRQAITRAIADQARTIRVPVHMFETINKLSRTKRMLVQELGREPSVEEIANSMKIPAEKVEEIIRFDQEPVSLERPVGEEEDSHLGDFLPDENTLDPEEAAYQSAMRNDIREVLRTLSEREAQVLIYRYGLDDNRPRTLEEVGEIFGVTRERIRQIEAKALRKIKCLPRCRNRIKGYL